MHIYPQLLTLRSKEDLGKAGEELLLALGGDADARVVHFEAERVVRERLLLLLFDQQIHLPHIFF